MLIASVVFVTILCNLWIRKANSNGDDKENGSVEQKRRVEDDRDIFAISSGHHQTRSLALFERNQIRIEQSQHSVLFRWW